MRTITKLGIGILTVIVLLACAWTYHTRHLYEKTYRSEYRYEITINTDSAVHNVTLYVPLPVFEEESKIGEEIIAENASKPDGWDCEIVETEHGKMLAICTEEMAPDFHSLPVPLPEGADSDRSSKAQVDMPKRVSAMIHANHEINTKNPAGNEPMLSPKYNLTRSVYMMPYPEDRSPPACYDYESRIYANYTAPSDAEVSIHAELTGANNWWVYDWSGNEYQDWSA